MVTESGAAKLLDFGLAKSTDSEVDVTRTIEGSVLGTAAYMFFIPIAAALAPRLGVYSFLMLFPLACFGTTLMLAFSYFRLGMMAQPSVTKIDAQAEKAKFHAQLASDFLRFLRAANQNERGTNFQADVFRGAVRTFVTRIVVLVLLWV